MRVAIVGAGVAGLSCADALAAAGHEVALFDKGRRPGGRMSTRRVDLDGRTLRFDHGAQYFTARDPAFEAVVRAWERAGVAARWPAAGPDAWVGAPAMSAIPASMAAAHRVSSATRIEAIARDGGRWRLKGADAHAFDAVAVALPAEQAAPLLAPHRPDFAAQARRTVSAPCWTAMAAFGEALGASRRIVRDDGPVGWAARDGDKPGRGDAESWVAQASPDWSAAHLEDEPARVAAALLGALGSSLGRALPAPVHLSAHRWRFARSGRAEAGPGALWAPAERIGACGDWLVAPRVESAWLSGARLAAMIG